ELFTIGRVDAVKTRPFCRRRADAKVNLGDARVAEHPHDLAARCPAHDRIIDDGDALPGEQLTDGVELQTHAEIPDALLRLDEGAADIMRADDAKLKGPVALFGVSERRRDAAIGDGHDDIDICRS